MNNTIIYLRTSTEEQNPENQLQDCETLALKLGLKNYEVFEDRVSGWKELERENFDKIKKAIERKSVNVLIVWDLDRLYRNRKRLIDFFELCKFYDCKIYSYRQEWLEGLNNIQSPFNEIVHNLMLQIMGWLAEEESNKKSERVKSAIKKKEGKTYSKFGRKWGRKSLSNNVKKEIIEKRNQGLSIREIAQSVWYWDRNNNRKFVSKSYVHKTLQEISP